MSAALVSRLSAKLNAPAKSAWPLVVSTVRSAEENADESSLAVSTTRGRSVAMTMDAIPPLGSSARRSMARSTALSRRVGLPSSDAIEPDASMTKTVCSLRVAASRRTGLATATASSTTANSCAMSSRLQRSFCHGEALLTGRSSERHRNVELTVTDCRRGRRMCRSTTGIARPNRASPAGLASETERPRWAEVIAPPRARASLSTPRRRWVHRPSPAGTRRLGCGSEQTLPTASDRRRRGRSSRCRG